MAPVVSYSIARGASAVIAALVWGVILAAVGTAIGDVLAVDGISLDEARGFLLVIAVFVPLFSAQGAVVGLLEGLLDGRFHAPAAAAEAPAQPRVANPWMTAARVTTLLGLPACLAALWLPGLLWHAPVPRAHLTGALVVLGMSLAAVSSLLCHGSFLSVLAVPTPDRHYTAGVARYRFRRLLLPHLLTNVAINAAVAVALVPRPAGLLRASAEAAVVTGDTAVMAFIVTLAVFAGARTQAKTDARFGVLVGGGDYRGSAARTALWVFACVAVTTGVAALLLFLTGGALSLPAFVAFKATAAAVLAWLAVDRGLVAGLAAASA